jgi:hypothetical protein
MRMQFEEIFNVNNDGTITPKIPVNTGCLIMVPGIKYPAKNSFLGLDILVQKEQNFEVDEMPGHDLVYMRDSSPERRLTSRSIFQALIPIDSLSIFLRRELSLTR